ncbi:hypothetical protein A3K71_00175 [archaeon RBG_16_50_20]|nr:MAG: hypothetical protein A3K71_00175 [archaeon RBG_16_50_20]
MKQPGKRVIWPANLDSTKSREEGRKLAKGLAVQAPRLEEINEAATRLSLEAEVAAGKSRPRSWWEKGGYVILPKNDARTTMLRSLASEIKKIRAAKSSQEKTRK